MKTRASRFLLSVAAFSFLAVGMASAEPLGQSLVLQPAAGGDFRSLRSRTLSKTDGTVAIELQSLDFAAGDYTLKGNWGGVPFASTYRIDNRAGLMTFPIQLVRQEYPCGDVHIETARLVLAPAADGMLELREASMQVEWTNDDCHLSRKFESLELEQRANFRATLRPRHLQDFKRIGARTLNPLDGSVVLDLQAMEFEGEQWILKGFWGSVPFIGKSYQQEASGPVWFAFEVYRKESPCAEGDYETVELVVASDSQGRFRLEEAGLRVESTADSCHLSPKGETISLVF